MKIEKTPLADCYIISPRIFKDERGIFFETFNESTFQKETALSVKFVQDNQSISEFGVLRGLHFQKGDFAQAKLVRVIQGKVLDIVVDLRKDSITFKKSFSIELDGKSNRQLFVPKGFAHGFITLSEKSIFAYKCDAFYDKASEGGILYNDETLNLDWTVKEKDMIISEKDLELPELKDLHL